MPSNTRRNTKSLSKKTWYIAFFFCTLLLINGAFAWYSDDPNNARDTQLRIYSDSKDAHCVSTTECYTILKLVNTGTSTKHIYLDLLFPANKDVTITKIEEQSDTPTNWVTKERYITTPCTNVTSTKVTDINGEHFVYRCSNNNAIVPNPTNATYLKKETYQEPEYDWTTITDTINNPTDYYNDTYYDKKQFKILKRINRYKIQGINSGPGNEKILRATFKVPAKSSGEFLLASDEPNSFLDPDWNATEVFDDFEDGNLFVNPVWTIVNGSPSISQYAKYHLNYGVKTPISVFQDQMDTNIEDRNYGIYAFYLQCLGNASQTNNAHNAVGVRWDTGAGFGDMIWVDFLTGPSKKCQTHLENTVGGVTLFNSNGYVYPDDVNQWIRGEIWLVGNGTAKVYVYDQNGDLLDSNTNLNTPPGSPLELFYINEANERYMDYILYAPPYAIDANFSYTIDKYNEEINFFDTSIPMNVTINDWNWLVNSSTTNLDNPNAQNPILSNVTQFTDYNVCLFVGGLGGDSNIYNDSICKTINSGRFSGRIIVNTFDEQTGAALPGVTINFDGNNYTSPMDENTTLTNITNAQQTITLTKTGYSTRYYIADMNKYTDLNLAFAMLEDANATNIPLKVYQTDETTIFANTYVEMYLPGNGRIVGRHKTNANGETTFSLSEIDQNYYANVNNGQYIYQPVALTILYPKNELTLLQITEKWSISITQNLYAYYSDLNANKIIFLLPNTALPFNIEIRDMNGNYFPRTYAKQYPGNPLTDTLQPYLVPLTDGLLTTINTRDAYSNTAIPNVTIKIYKYISGSGRTYVEEVVTDSKGQALSLLVLNAQYEFEAYYNGQLLKTFSITATSSTIFIYLTLPATEPTITPKGFNVSYTPYIIGQQKYSSGTKTFTQTINNLGRVSATYLSQIIDANGFILSSQNITTSNASYTFTHNVPWALINLGSLKSKVTITADGNTTYYQQAYNINNAFDMNYNIMYGLTTDIRSDFGCQDTGMCIPLLVISIIISIALAIWASMLTQSFSGQATGFLFLIPMILFTYLTWVPLELTVGMVIIMLAFIIYERR